MELKQPSHTLKSKRVTRDTLKFKKLIKSNNSPGAKSNVWVQ